MNFTYALHSSGEKKSYARVQREAAPCSEILGLERQGTYVDEQDLVLKDRSALQPFFGGQLREPDCGRFARSCRGCRSGSRCACLLCHGGSGLRIEQGHSSCREATILRSPVRESRDERNASVPRKTGNGQTALYLKNVTLPEWLTGSPATRSCQRLGFARECSNRSGDDFLLPVPRARVTTRSNENGSQDGEQAIIMHTGRS